VTLGENEPGRGGREGLAALKHFWSLKKGTRTFDFRSNEPYPNILLSLVRYDYPWRKKNKKKTNKHASVIFLLAKMHNSTFLYIAA
jgi:hypothetical protein